MNNGSEAPKMDQHKVVSDWIITTQDTIYTLQMWIGLLESWRDSGQAEPDDFMDACRQLCEAGLGSWANEAGGHGIVAVAEALGLRMEARDVIENNYRNCRWCLR